MVMATAKEIKKHLLIALKEIGKIQPWFDEEVSAWVFSHPLYPVEYAGGSKKEVIKNYPLYLQDFIEERLNDNLSPLVKKRTKGRGGKRKGAGRPKGTLRGRKKRVSLPADIAAYVSRPESFPAVRQLIAKSR